MVMGHLKAQGATEYLILVAVVSMIVLVCIALLTWPIGTTKDAKQSTSDIHAKIAAMEFPDLVPSLVAYYKFDEGSGTSAADSRGGNNGNLTNGATWTTGKSGYGMQFDGVNDYVKLPNFAKPTSGQISILAWFKATATAQRQIIDMRETSSSGVYLGVNYVAGDVYAAINNDANLLLLSPSTAFNDGAWHHVAVTYNGLSPKLYADGVLVNTTSASASMVGSTFTSSIGSRYTKDSLFFNGSIDEVMIFNRALSASEIRLLYENPGYPQ